ncbi:DnaJ protein erdj2a [Castilleja foliolosa]|uniref:DnaJ protein erdj2a n=1 Tax=Castilleja foliolosa TaxID=1961234 RepID=A0ABD3DVX3_9LAMI
MKGLGIFSFTFDWSIVASFLQSPLVSPFFAIGAKERIQQVVNRAGDKDISDLCTDPPDIDSLIANVTTCGNFSLVLLWVIVGFLVYYIKNMSREIQVFEPFSILGLESGATDHEIKKAYRRLSIQYHPDKNPDPAAHQYFVESISKAYQALTDPISHENFEKYGHPDGRQVQMGIALPQFILNIDGSSGGILLLWIVVICILLPLVLAAVYLSRSAKYTGNYVKNDTLGAYFHMMKPSLAPM